MEHREQGELDGERAVYVYNSNDTPQAKPGLEPAHRVGLTLVFAAKRVYTIVVVGAVTVARTARPERVAIFVGAPGLTVVVLPVGARCVKASLLFLYTSAFCFSICTTSTTPPPSVALPDWAKKLALRATAGVEEDLFFCRTPLVFRPDNELVGRKVYAYRDDAKLVPSRLCVI